MASRARRFLDTYATLFLAGFLIGSLVGAVSGQDLGERIQANHLKYVPDGPGPFPTVIAIPGCSGVSVGGEQTDAGRPGDEGDRLFRRHYPRAALRLKEAGFAVLLVDYLSAEGVQNACGGQIPPPRIAEYITASSDFAVSRPFVDRSRLHVVAWSLGGAGLLSWLERFGTASGSIRSAVAVYPGCDAATAWKSSISLLMLLAGADDVAPPQVCERVVAQLPPTASVRVRTYPGARHGFDWTEGPTRLDIGGGRTLGRDASAAGAAWGEMMTFLKP